MDLNAVPLTPAHPFSPKLPPELCDYVIDALADDRDPWTGILPEDTDRALKNCALVCHDWRPRAELHLNGDIFIGDVDALTGLAQRMSATSTVLAPHVTYLDLTLPRSGLYPPNNVLTHLPMLFRLGVSSIHELKMEFDEYAEFLRSESEPEETEENAVFVPCLPLHPRFLSLATPVFSTLYGICTYGVNRILATLSEGQLHVLTFQFEDKGEQEGQDVLPADPVTGENAQISLARFTNLDKLTVWQYGPEHLESLRAVLRSWNPTEAPSRHLEVASFWRTAQSVLSPNEDTNSVGQNVSALEESWGSAPPLTIQFTVQQVPKTYKGREEEISMNMKKLFPKASEEGRLKVNLYYAEEDYE